MNSTNVTESVAVSADAWAALRRHAAANPAAECCGALCGHAAAGTIVATLPVSNEAEEPARRYRIGGAAVRRLEAEAQAAGLDIVGFYHSHPDGSTHPSPRDLDLAWPGYLYFIVPVTGSATSPGAVPAAWRLRDDRSRFDPVPVRIVHG